MRLLINTRSKWQQVCKWQQISIEYFNLNGSLFAKDRVMCFIVCARGKADVGTRGSEDKKEMFVSANRGFICLPFFFFNLNFATPSGNWVTWTEPPCGEEEMNPECLLAAVLLFILLLWWHEYGGIWACWEKQVYATTRGHHLHIICDYSEEVRRGR